MASLLLVLILLFTIALYTVSSAGTDDIRVVATAPVNPVEQDGILSIRCQVWHLGQDQEVALVRRIPTQGRTETERLSLKEEVISNDERMFLAMRQLEDSSTVYFLSIMRITRRDAGIYRCAVYGDDGEGRFEELIEDSVPVKVTYFPDAGPECEPYSGNYAVLEGSEVVFNCSADSGFPAVALTWSRASPDSVIDTKQSIDGDSSRGGHTYTVLRRTIRREDEGVVFLCTMSSRDFPDRNPNCHVGPLHVILNPNSVSPGRGSQSETPRQPTTNRDNDVSLGGSGSNDVTMLDQGTNNLSPRDCSQECSYTVLQVEHALFKNVLFKDLYRKVYSSCCHCLCTS